MKAIKAYDSTYPGSMSQHEGGGYIQRDDPDSLAAALLELVKTGDRAVEDLQDALNEAANDAKQLRAELAALRDAVRPFARLVKDTNGRIPTERLSFADWDLLVKASNGYPAAQQEPECKNDVHAEKVKDESGITLKPCPDCGRDDELAIDSCGALGLSQVICDCGHLFQCRAYEENIGRHWNKHCKEKPPDVKVTGVRTE